MSSRSMSCEEQLSNQGRCEQHEGNEAQSMRCSWVSTERDFNHPNADKRKRTEVLSKVKSEKGTYSPWLCLDDLRR
jgi:hypothetical protein